MFKIEKRRESGVICMHFKEFYARPSCGRAISGEEKDAACAVETQRQHYKKTSLDSLENQKRDYLGLAKKFHVPISCAIAHYDTLSMPDI